MARKGFGRGSGRGRGRPRKVKPEDVVQSNELQIALDFSVEAKVEGFDKISDLRRRIDALAAVASDANKEKRTLEKEKIALERQGAAGKRTVTVEVDERADFEHGIVTTHRRDTGEQVSEREMTDGEMTSGSVLTGRGPVSRIAPGDAASMLHEVAAHAAHVGSNGKSFGERVAEDVAAFEASGEGEYSLPSASAADVAAVVEAVQR